MFSRVGSIELAQGGDYVGFEAHMGAFDERILRIDKDEERTSHVYLDAASQRFCRGRKSEEDEQDF